MRKRQEGLSAEVQEIACNAKGETTHEPHSAIIFDVIVEAAWSQRYKARQRLHSRYMRLLGKGMRYASPDLYLALGKNPIPVDTH
jgi:hypothetical protein